jgi:hypothetical protein
MAMDLVLKLSDILREKYAEYVVTITETPAMNLELRMEASLEIPILLLTVMH